MPRLIDADKLKLHYAWWDNEEQRAFDTIVDMQPTVDVHARWERTKPTSVKSYRRICSFCGQVAYMINEEYKYCPNCGAKMDGEQK